MAGIQPLFCGHCPNSPGLFNVTGCKDVIPYEHIATLILPCKTSSSGTLSFFNPKNSSATVINMALANLLTTPDYLFVVPTTVGRFDNLGAQDPVEGLDSDGYGGKQQSHAAVKNRKMMLHRGAQLAPGSLVGTYHTTGYDLDRFVEDFNKAGKVAAIGEIFNDELGNAVLRWWVVLDLKHLGTFPNLLVSASNYQDGTPEQKQLYKAVINVSQAGTGGLTLGGSILLDAATIQSLEQYL
jgi:hypothetical protein